VADYKTGRVSVERKLVVLTFRQLIDSCLFACVVAGMLTYKGIQPRKNSLSVLSTCWKALQSPPDVYHIDDDHVDGRYYVSELRPSADLLLIPQVIYEDEHGERWWNDIDRRILIRPPELWR
jgi:hypothetical protein